mmetsp:Transcript_24602/g.47940  ORF Transcript_24602/g.47940 Transcript_24602/m.47940 type:complete len:470 (+) Transcript_24602:59-1468(+)
MAVRNRGLQASFFLLFVVPPVWGRSEAGASERSHPRRSNEGPITLPLSRRLVTLRGRNDDMSAFGVSANAFAEVKSFYLGTIGVGIPAESRQEMLVVFDTSSGQVVLDSTRCDTPSCRQHRQYSAEKSGGKDVFVSGHVVKQGEIGDSASISFDSHDEEAGSVEGDLVRDTVCLGSERITGSRGDACADIILVAAENMTGEYFQQAPFDGVVGLSLAGLSINSESNFFGRLTTQIEGLEPQFALYVPRQPEDGRAEISFGGYNPNRLAGPLKWAPVVEPEKGAWQVHIASVKIGNKVMDVCKEAACLGVVDSSSSHIGVPFAAWQDLEETIMLGIGVENKLSDDCTAGPDLHFTLNDGTALTLTAKEYAMKSEIGCRTLLHPLSVGDHVGGKKYGAMQTQIATELDGSFVLGEPLLRRYYTVFDWNANSLGFGLASGASPDPEDERPLQTEDFILLQCKQSKKKIASLP